MEFSKLKIVLLTFKMPGFPVFGTGQPTIDGFSRILEPILKKYGEEKNIFWVNLRQEPVIYVNGKPFTARDPAEFSHNFFLLLITSIQPNFSSLFDVKCFILTETHMFHSGLNLVNFTEL